MTKIKGIDVSYHNGIIDWAKVAKTDVKFAIIREGYRKTIDSKFLDNVKNARANNLPVMVYHFIYTDNATIQENAVSTVNNMKLANLSLTDTWVWVDLEGDTWVKNKETCTKEKCSAYTLDYIRKLESLGVKKIGIYMNNSYYKNYYSVDLLNNYPIWLADYSGEPDYKCVMQQYTSSGSCDGIPSSGLDMNYLFDESLIYKKTETTTIEGGNNMATKICHAAISENGNAGWDGRAKAGDQTGREVCTRDWYAKGWNIMLRYPDASIAKKAATIATKLANSNLVGYDQSQRNTLYQKLKANNWNVDAYIKSGVKTETDCSAFVYVCYCCLIPAMRSDNNAPTTSTMRNQYIKFGFKLYTDSKYTSTGDYLQIGDVVCKEGSHTAMSISVGAKVTSIPNSVVNNQYSGKGIGYATAKQDMMVRTGAGTTYTSCGSVEAGSKVEVLEILNNKWYKIVWPSVSCGYAYTSNSTDNYYKYVANATSTTASVTASQRPESKLASLEGNYKTTTNLNLRDGAGTGTSCKVLVTLPKDATVSNYGYYTSVNGTKWLWVKTTYNKVTYTGFVSSAYLKKQ